MPEKPRERLAALALAAQQLAAEVEPLPRALDVIAKRVRVRIKPVQRPGDDDLVDDLHRLRGRAFALPLDVRRLEQASRAIESALSSFTGLGHPPYDPRLIDAGSNARQESGRGESTGSAVHRTKGGAAMVADEGRIRREIVGAAVRTPGAMPATPPPADPSLPARAGQPLPREHRPRVGPAWLCGAVGLLVIFFGAASGGAYGPALVIAGSVFLGSAFVVAAITQLRVDLWRSRNGAGE